MFSLEGFANNVKFDLPFKGMRFPPNRSGYFERAIFHFGGFLIKFYVFLIAFYFKRIHNQIVGLGQHCLSIEVSAVSEDRSSLTKLSSQSGQKCPLICCHTAETSENTHAVFLPSSFIIFLIVLLSLFGLWNLLLCMHPFRDSLFVFIDLWQLVF